MLRALKVSVFAIIAVLCCAFLPSLAFAQGSLPAAAPALSVGVVVVTLLSVLAGVVTQAQQSGKLFGTFVIPGAAMIGLTLAAPFLGGMTAYLASVSFSSAALFWGAMAGVTNVVAASASGIAVHAAIVTPAHMAAIRAAKLAKIAGTGVLGILFAAILSGCGWIKANEPALVSDITAVGKCELTYIASVPSPTPAGAVAACAGLLLADAESTFVWLEATPDGGSPSALGLKLRSARGAK